MNHVDKYASIPAEFRKHVLRALGKPANKRTETEREFIDLSEKWLAVAKKCSGVEASTRAMEAEIALEAGRGIKLSTRENQKFIRKMLDVWRSKAREALAPTGWNYDEERLRWERNGQSQIKRPDLPSAELLESVEFAKRVIAEGDAENGVFRGLVLAIALVNNGHENLLKDAVRNANRRYAQKPRRPKSPTKRVIRCAIKEGHQTAAQVKAYLETTAEVRDKWGLMSITITDDGDCFTIEDMDGPKNEHGEYPEGIVYKSRLAVLVSQVRNEK